MHPSEQPSEPAIPALSRREVEVIHLVAEGLTDKEIATRLSISAKTVSEHVERARNKLGAANRASAVYVFFVKQREPVLA
jgi:DNA-binding NarL/FixJ family response regulator